jgi:hypothetical protein
MTVVIDSFDCFTARCMGRGSTLLLTGAALRSDATVPHDRWGNRCSRESVDSCVLSWLGGSTDVPTSGRPAVAAGPRTGMGLRHPGLLNRVGDPSV